jgi:hypothetical protein
MQVMKEKQMHLQGLPVCPQRLAGILESIEALRSTSSLNAVVLKNLSTKIICLKLLNQYLSSFILKITNCSFDLY